MRIGVQLGIQISKVVGLDPATIAFITAAGITDNTQINAVNNLVLNLKGIGPQNNSINLWNDRLAVYPIVGGSATSHKFNLKDPQDTNGAFRMVFSGGWIHNSTGMTPNGTNAYADTNFNPVTQSLSTSNAGLYLYQRQAPDSGTTRSKMGAETGSVVDSIHLLWGNAGTAERGIVAAASNAEYTPIPAESSAGITGSTMVTTSGDRIAKYYANGVQRGTGATQTGSMPNLNIYIGAVNRAGSALNFFNKEIAFASIGRGASSSNALLYHQIVVAFQTELGRAV